MLVVPYDLGDSNLYLGYHRFPVSRRLGTGYFMRSTPMPPRITGVRPRGRDVRSILVLGCLLHSLPATLHRVSLQV
jgi:hypothetical protein